MSWDVSLVNDDGEIVEVDRFEEGGTRCVGGSTIAELNVTYNYNEVTKLIWFHFKDGLDGYQARDTIRILLEAVEKLGTLIYKDYWAPTPGNAGFACFILLGWARQHPDCTWVVR